MKDILLVGGGGHCCACIDVIELMGEYRIRGVIDSNFPKGQLVLGYPALGSDDDLEQYVEQIPYALVTVGQINSAEIRIKLYTLLKRLGFKLPTIVSPRAYIAKNVEVGEGSIVMHDALLNANSKVGANCIINTKALLEHDVIVEDNCHISTSAVVNGHSVIKKEGFIGSNATIVQALSVPENSFIKACQLYKGEK